MAETFYSKLVLVAQSVGMKLEDLMLAMYLESGFDPAAFNKSGASGLMQLMPFMLGTVGFKGTAEEFSEVPAIEQLDYVQKHLQNKISAHGGAFSSPAQFYLAHFYPAALSLPGVKQNNPSQPIIEANPLKQKYPRVSLRSERAAYRQNRGLDVDNDGVISYGDIINKIEGIKASKGFKTRVEQLKNNQPIQFKKRPPASEVRNQNAEPKPQNSLPADKSDLFSKLDQFASEFKNVFACRVEFKLYAVSKYAE